MGGYSSVFKDIDSSCLSDSDSVFILCSVKTSANPKETKENVQIVEFSTTLFDISDCKVYGSFSTHLVKDSDLYYFDEEYNMDYNCIEKSDLKDGYTYAEVLDFLYNKLWYSAYQKPKVLKVIVINSQELAPIFMDLFKDSHLVLNRNLAKSKIEDINSLDFVRDFNKFLKSKGVKYSLYEDISSFFNISVDLNTLNEILLLAGYIHLAKVHQMCILAEYTDECILSNLIELKSSIAREIKETSSKISKYVLPEVIL